MSICLSALSLDASARRCVELIGEAARRIDEATRQLHPEVPWRDIIGQRNILAHEYGQIDYELLYRTASEDVPQLAWIPDRILADRG